jgi:hypothetical protein
LQRKKEKTCKWVTSVKKDFFCFCFCFFVFFLVFGFWGCCRGAVGVVVGLRFRSFAVGVVVGGGNGVGEREGDDDVKGISKAMATTDSRDNIYATAWRWES